MSEFHTERLEELIGGLDQTTLETKRLVMFVLVAVKEDVWPMAEFMATPASETDEQCIELFHSLIRTIPEADRTRCWAEVQETFPVHHAVT